MKPTETRNRLSFFTLQRLLPPVASACLTVGCNVLSLPTHQGVDTTVSVDPDHALGWSEASHGKDAKPDYAAAFSQTQVRTFQITIAPSDWQKMLDDMTKLYGARGTGTQRGGPGGQPRGPRPKGMPGGPPGGQTQKPVWVPSTVSLDGKTWVHVGVRFKGNSSLMTGWQSGTDRMPFKLDFRQFEKDYPEVKNQKFYGFKELSMSTNMGDETQMRDSLMYDVLEESGLPAAKTTFYKLVIDHGAGKSNLGIYTGVEVIDDTVVDRVFKGKKGNIYEGDGPGVTLADGTLESIKTSFQKENNKDSDWSDIEQLYAVLHDKGRITDTAAWRKRLEAVFDVDGFLSWLAIAAVSQHWDAYGNMTHNFYLYHNPANDKLTWISWDHNLVLGAAMGPEQGGPPGGMMPPPGGMPFDGAATPGMGFPGGIPPGGPPGGFGGKGSLDRKDVTDRWPLIRYLLDDPTYYTAYTKHLAGFIHGPFTAEKMHARTARYAGLLSPVAAEHPGTPAYESAVSELNKVIDGRIKAVTEFLAKPSL